MCDSPVCLSTTNSPATGSCMQTCPGLTVHLRGKVMTCTKTDSKCTRLTQPRIQVGKFYFSSTYTTTPTKLWQFYFPTPSLHSLPHPAPSGPSHSLMGTSIYASPPTY